MKINKLLIMVTVVIMGVIVLTSSFFKKNQYVVPIASFSEIDFNAIDKDTLVIFDVDETLIQPVDMYFINEGRPEAKAIKRNL